MSGPLENLLLPAWPLMARTIKALNDAATVLIDSGVTVVVSAGNEAKDASDYVSCFCCRGHRCRCIRYHEHHVHRAAISVQLSTYSLQVLTSPRPGSVGQAVPRWALEHRMAAAHVAGIAAYFLSKNPSMTPAAIRTKILSLATKNVISGVPAGTVTDFVFNGVFHSPLAPPSDPATPTESGDTSHSQFTCPGLVEELPLELVQPVEWSPHHPNT